MAQAHAVPASGPKLDNRRVIAALIDLAVVGVGGAAILAVAGVLGEPPSEIGVPLFGVILGWALYYYFACESAAGQTLGKRLMNIRVVRTDGAPAGMREIALRTVLRVIDMQLFYLVGLGVMLATRDRRGRLGDLVGDTMIVSAERHARVAHAPAAVAAPAVARVPIAESGPAFEPVAEHEPMEAPQDDADDVASPSLQELASDVAATAGSAPDPVEDEPVVELLEDEPDVEVVEDEPVARRSLRSSRSPRTSRWPRRSPRSRSSRTSRWPRKSPRWRGEDEPEASEQPEESEDEDEEVTVRSVETVSAIDLVMDDSRRES